jgi:hypothetical protein
MESQDSYRSEAYNEISHVTKILPQLVASSKLLLSALSLLPNDDSIRSQ